VSFLAAHWLWLLLVVAALGAGYVWVQRTGRRNAAVRFTNLDLLASVAPRRPGWQRHIAAGLLLAALAAMVFTLARPIRNVRVAKREATVVLAVDVSVSMEATDVEPNRLIAAQTAADGFVDGLPGGVQLGLVAFAGSARVLVPPTDDHDAVRDAIGSLRLSPGTAIGDAVLASLEAIGDAEAASIVLMSDGTTTVGTPNADATEEAAAAEVPVTTIAFGTPDGEVTLDDGRTLPVPADPEQLAAISEGTGGRTFEAATAEELSQVYDDIRLAVGYDTERREFTTWMAGAAFVLGSLAAAAALRWSARLP
jgi:Ca-activated chloride channel homolog